MIYFLIAFLLLVFSFKFDFYKNKRGKTFCYGLSWLILALLAGFRYKVGGDTYIYMYVYKSLPTFSELFSIQGFNYNYEFGFLFLTAIAKLFSPDFTLLQILIAIIVNTTFFWFIKKHTKYYFTAVLIYFIAFYPYFNFEILRESLAVCVFMLSYDSLLNKNYKKYYGFVIIAFLFHVSSIILFFMPFFLKVVKNINIKTYIIVGLVFVSGLFFNNFIIEISEIFSFTQILTSNIEDYNDYSFTIYGILSALGYYIIVPLFFLKPFKKKNDPKEVIIMMKVYLLVGASITFYSIFFRFLNYFAVFYILLLTEYVFHYYNNSKLHKGNIVSSLFLLMFIFVLFNFKYTSIVERSHSIRWYSRWYPYHSIFDKIEDPAREIMFDL